MKTKELIQRLQEADPSGELECCVGNIDIYFITQEPAYYDGPLQVLTHDASLRDKAWSITGAKIVSSGTKVQIHTLSIEDVILDEVYEEKDFPVTIEGDSIDGYYHKIVAKWKQEAITITKEVKKKYEQVNITNQ